ncbi:MAG: hypothetical protein ACRYFX_28595 [Janthinobacterium lividum]
MRLSSLTLALALGGLLASSHQAQAQKTKSVPFSYLPEEGEDRYNMRVPQKTLPLADGSGFVILAHQSGSTYSVERYTADLKKQWSTTLLIAPGETVEAFGRSDEQAWVVLHHGEESGQILTAYPVALASGQKGTAVVLVSASADERRPSVRLSPDGKRLLAYRYVLRDTQIRSLEATLYDQHLTKVLDRTYDFRDQGDFFSPNVLLANDGTQYVTLLGDNMRKITVRRYPGTPDQAGTSTPVPTLGVPLGGVFGGQPVTIRDAKFSLLPDGQLYAAALCANSTSGELTSLKAVRFDFAESRMRLADELPFSPAFLAEVNKAINGSLKRLDDIYLSDFLLTDSKNLVMIAERHFEEGGPELPVHARELYVFGFNSFMKPSWHLVIPKDQTAPAIESYTGIGLKAAVFGEEIQLLTLENIEGKSDLYLRRLQAPTGIMGKLQRLKLNVAPTVVGTAATAAAATTADAPTAQPLAYVKDFTAWLDPKTIIGVSRPNKKSKALQINEVKFK